MSELLSSAMETHLRRCRSSTNADNDSTSDVSEAGKIAGSHPADSQQHPSEEPSLLSLVLEDPLHRGLTTENVLFRWWHWQQPIIVNFIHEYGAILIKFLTPFTPRTARRAGYRCAFHKLAESLDRMDGLLGGDRWSSRFSSRWLCRSERGQEGAVLPLGATSCDGPFGVGVAATVVFAAASWCRWRRSSPTWPVLLAEIVCVSTWAANYFAREDGHREATLFKTRLTALESSLWPFFRGVQACMRMVKCSQTLSFGLRLSVPMPPVARMEGRLSAIDSNREPSRPEVALRELRSVLMDVLEGAVTQVNAFRSKKRASEVTGGGDKTPDFAESDGGFSGSEKSQAPQLLADIAIVEKNLTAYLRQFVADVAANINAAMVEPEMWGAWWNSQLKDVSEHVRDLTRYFETSTQRIEETIGLSGPLVPPSNEINQSGHGEIAATAEALSALRLHYEETLVRLYGCQSSVIPMLRDSQNSTAHAWEVIRQELVDARAAVGPAETENELWQKTENLVETLAKNDSQSDAYSSTDASPTSEPPPDEFRHLEAGVGWVSLSTPRGENPHVFEGGNFGDTLEDKSRVLPGMGITNVLVGVPSPGRSRREEDHIKASTKALEEFVDERSRSQLVGELDSVLRARPLPPTCEKHLPLESQQSLYHGIVEDGKASEAISTQDVKPSDNVSLPTPTPEMPVTENLGNQDLMSELRAQLSLAANEEIFSCNRDQDMVSSFDSNSEGDSIFIGHERQRHDEDDEQRHG